MAAAVPLSWITGLLYDMGIDERLTDAEIGNMILSRSG